MPKKYIVRLTAKELRVPREVVQSLKGSSQKVRRAQMLLKVDAAGPAWTDEQIAEAFDSRTRTVEKLRERFVTAGFEQTLHGKPRNKPPTEKIMNGKQARGAHDRDAAASTSQGLCQLDAPPAGRTVVALEIARFDQL